VSWRGSAVVKKDLRLIATAVCIPLSCCLVVDDTPSTYSGNPSNALPVPTCRPGAADDTLPALASFLREAGVQTHLDVRGWRHASARAGVLVPDRGQVLGGTLAGTGQQQPDIEEEDDGSEDDDLDALIC
jgi:hypothetical protein